MTIRRIVPGETRVGWIGTGVMGASMCGHLIDKGFAATVYNRTRSKAEPLLAKGAAWADSPREVAEQSEVVFTIVGFPRDVREVILGESGALAGSGEGNILVDMSTSEPSLAVEIAEQAKAKGVYSVDAPVSGGDIGAREARLSIMTAETGRRSRPFSPAGRRWARRSFIKADPAPVSTRRWSIRRSSRRT